MCTNIKQNRQFHFLGLTLSKNGIPVGNSKKLMSEEESTFSKYYVCQLSGKMNNFDFFDPNLSKNGFWGRNFEN